MLVMPRPFTREGIETRLAIRKAFEANPALSRPDLCRQFNVLQTMVDSALGKTATEWQALLDATPAGNPRIEKDARAEPTRGDPHHYRYNHAWPRAMHCQVHPQARQDGRSGLVDPNVEYEIYLKKK